MLSSLVLEPRAIPLTRLDNGTWRVTGTRIALELVVEQYKAGSTPAQIVDAFDSLRLSDVYVLIAYYLDHEADVEEYLREQDVKAEEIRRRIEATQPPRPGFREELLRRKALMDRGEWPPHNKSQ
jgi:uncharacterized protein (DUF433 family)